MNTAILKYRALRRLGRLTTESAALLTRGTMPPFVAACAIIERNGTYLAIRDNALGMLALPGGHLRWTESAEQGVIREVHEETGYSVKVEHLKGVVDASSGLADRGIIRLVYSARTVGGVERGSAEGQVEWVTLEQLTNESARDAGILARWA